MSLTTTTLKTGNIGERVAEKNSEELSVNRNESNLSGNTEPLWAMIECGMGKNICQNTNTPTH